MRTFNRLQPGDTFSFQKKDREFDLATFTADILSTLMNIVAIASLVDNND